MKKINLSISPQVLVHCVLAILMVLATTGVLWSIGRDLLGEAVIALLYLLPVGWSTSRWGQVPGFCAAVMAFLMFDFFFIPPFNTFEVGSLEGWMVLLIFLGVAVVIVGRIQTHLSRALASERDAILMYELSVGLAGSRTQEAVAQTLAKHLQQVFQASLARVVVQAKAQAPALIAHEPPEASTNGKPDYVFPIQGTRGLVGEIQMWQGEGQLPSTDSRLLRSFATQTASALERARLAEVAPDLNGALNSTVVK